MTHVIERAPALNPIFGPNKLKLGIFGTNGKGTSNTLMPGFHRPTWDANLRTAKLADDAGLEAIVPYARWKGHELGKLDHPSGVVLDPYTWAAGLAQAPASGSGKSSSVSGMSTRIGATPVHCLSPGGGASVRRMADDEADPAANPTTIELENAWELLPICVHAAPSAL